MPIVNPNGTGPKNRPKPKIPASVFAGNVHARSNQNRRTPVIFNQDSLVQPHEKRIVTADTKQGPRTVVIVSPSSSTEKISDRSFTTDKTLGSRHDSSTPKWNFGRAK